MNLAVTPDAWRVTPRYVAYDMMVQEHLEAGADTRLASMCHAAIFTEISLREASRDYALAELRGSDLRCREIEASQHWHRCRLRELLIAVAELSPRTDIGLIWKGDTLIHMVEFFEPETMPEVVTVARFYAEEVSMRLSGEIADCRAKSGNAVPVTLDIEFLMILQHVRECLDRCDAAATRMRMLLRRGPESVDETPHRLEEDLADREREVDETLERAHLFQPTTPNSILGLAQLVAALLANGRQSHQHLTVCGLCRSLANAVRQYVGAVVVSSGPAGVS